MVCAGASALTDEALCTKKNTAEPAHRWDSTKKGKKSLTPSAVSGIIAIKELGSVAERIVSEQ
jgi:hypothetical protein